MARPKKNINHIPLAEKVHGYERQVEIAKMPLDKSLYTPHPVVLKDMDDAFREWAESIKIVGEDGTEYPTMVLFSNQRFSEYSQNWSHTDKNNNLLLNFKTVSRANNPQYGNIHKRLWNIPGDRYYTVKRFRALDDNGSESYLNVSMRQPMSCDLDYKLSLFTNKYQDLNTFNTTINKLFQARQCYLCPNGYYMPMTLDNISDESEYSIDDRQFYSQTYSIKLMGYILEEKDFRVSELPLKKGVNFCFKGRRRITADVDIESEEKAPEKSVITLTYPRSVKSVEFVMDSDFMIEGFEYDNLSNSCKILVNDEEVLAKKGTIFRTDDRIKVTVRHRDIFKEGILKIKGKYPF